MLVASVTFLLSRILAHVGVRSTCISNVVGGGGVEASVKITVKFLSNEIRPDGLEVLVYKKNCKSFESCQSNKTDSKINSELKMAILKKAARIEKADLVKKNN